MRISTLVLTTAAFYADIAGSSAVTLDHLHNTDQHAAARAYTAALGVNMTLNGSWSCCSSTAAPPGAASRLSDVVRVRHGACHPHLADEPAHIRVNPTRFTIDRHRVHRGTELHYRQYEQKPRTE